MPYAKPPPPSEGKQGLSAGPSSTGSPEKRFFQAVPLVIQPPGQPIFWLNIYILGALQVPVHLLY